MHILLTNTISWLVTGPLFSLLFGEWFHGCLYSLYFLSEVPTLDRLGLS